MNSFEVTIDRIENEKAVVKTADNETVVLPASWFPGDAKESNIFYISIKNLQDKEKEGKEMARNILNEILDIEE